MERGGTVGEGPFRWSGVRTLVARRPYMRNSKFGVPLSIRESQVFSQESKLPTAMEMLRAEDIDQ